MELLILFAGVVAVVFFMASLAGSPASSEYSRSEKRKEQWKFYGSRQWDVLRRSVLTTYGMKCMKCEIQDVEMHVDHIKPRSKYPHLAMDFNNLQVLCRDCNKEKSNTDETDYRKKILTPRWVNPRSGRTYWERQRESRFKRKPSKKRGSW